MKVTILQSNYIPWKGYFDMINDADVFVFYDCVKYTKNDWRNRNMIYVNKAKQWITIPISAESTNMMIDEVVIKNTSWQDLHFKSLHLGYKRAPYFSQLEELMNDYLVEKHWSSLSELNQYLIKTISSRIGITTKFVNAREFDLKTDRIERLVYICNRLNATEYISGKAAQNYLDGNESIFEKNNIKLTYKTYPNYKSYKQLYEPFEQAVSIVDMIANLHYDDIKNYIWNNTEQNGV